MLKISYAGCLGLFPAIAAQFTFKMCACVTQPRIAKKNKTPLFWGFKVVYGHRCCSTIKLVSRACYDKQHVSAYLAIAAD